MSTTTAAGNYLIPEECVVVDDRMCALRGGKAGLSHDLCCFDQEHMLLMGARDHNNAYGYEVGSELKQ